MNKNDTITMDLTAKEIAGLAAAAMTVLLTAPPGNATEKQELEALTAKMVNVLHPNAGTMAIDVIKHHQAERRAR